MGNKRLVALAGWAFIALVVAGTVDIGSRVGFSIVASPELKRQIEAVRSGKVDESYVISNAIWHHELNPHNKSYTLNRWGTRGEDFEMPKPAGELRVLAVGDSTTEGWKNKDNETYPHYLQEILRRHLAELPGIRTVKVINAGIGSHTSSFSLAYFSQRLIHFSPDIVVFKSAYNDVNPFVRTNLGYDYTNTYQQPLPAGVRNSRFWKVASRVPELKLLGALLLDPPFDQTVGLGGFVISTREEFEKNLEKRFLFERNMISLITIAKRFHIKPIQLDFPSSPQKEHYFISYSREIDRWTVREFAKQLSESAARIAKLEDVPFVKTAPILTADDFWDHVHNTPSGNRKIAQAVAGSILHTFRRTSPTL